MEDLPIDALDISELPQMVSISKLELDDLKEQANKAQMLRESRRIYLKNYRDTHIDQERKRWNDDLKKAYQKKKLAEDPNYIPRQKALGVDGEESVVKKRGRKPREVIEVVDVVKRGRGRPKKVIEL
jgi:hypothetical protein